MTLNHQRKKKKEGVGMSLKVDVKSIYHLVLERAGKPIGLLEEGSYISLGKFGFDCKHG